MSQQEDQNEQVLANPDENQQVDEGLAEDQDYGDEGNQQQQDYEEYGVNNGGDSEQDLHDPSQMADEYG